MFGVRFYSNGRDGGFEHGVITAGLNGGPVNLAVFQDLHPAPDPGPQTNTPGAPPADVPQIVRHVSQVLPYSPGAEGKPGNTTRFYEPA